MLRDRDDFSALAAAYFERAAADNVVHAELFFDPQTHTVRGVAMATIIDGLHDAMAEARSKHGITSSLILCFLRHLSEADALATLDAALPYRDAVRRRRARLRRARQSAEQVHRACSRRRAPPGSTRSRMPVKKARPRTSARRSRCSRSSASITACAATKIRRSSTSSRCRRSPLTVCPLSNKALKVTPDLAKHNFATLLRAGVAVTINSDDPAYFGGYIAENYRQTAEALDLTVEEIVTVAENAVRAAFIGPEEKDALLVTIARRRVANI